MKADEYLREQDIEFEEVLQENPAKSCDDAARERGLETGQIVKSLIIESEGEKFHVLLPGDRSLSEKKLGGEYRMVPPEKSKEMTGFESGTVHPFSTELKHVIDERVFENDRVSHTVGEKTRGVILDAVEFRKAVEDAGFDFEVRDIAVSTGEDLEEVGSEGLGEEDAKFVVENGYRRKFLELSESFEPGNVLDLLKAFDREGKKPECSEEVLERAENQTHMQRMVESLAEDGELPEDEGFDLGVVVEKVLDENPEAVDDFQEGKDSAINYLMGQVMQETNGKAEAGEVQRKLREDLR